MRIYKNLSVTSHLRYYGGEFVHILPKEEHALFLKQSGVFEILFWFH